MTTPRLLMAIFLGPALLGACESSGEPGGTTSASSTGADTESTASTASTEMTSEGATEATTTATTGATTSDSTTEATTAGACEPAACSDMCSKWSDEGCTTVYFGECKAGECVCEPGSGGCPPPITPVMCGEVTCVEGQICLQPGIDCDYNQDPPEFFTPPPRCEDVPAECTTKLESELPGCLGAAFCEFSVVGEPAYADGTLECPPEAADCF